MLDPAEPDFKVSESESETSRTGGGLEGRADKAIEMKTAESTECSKQQDIGCYARNPHRWQPHRAAAAAPNGGGGCNKRGNDWSKLNACGIVPMCGPSFPNCRNCFWFFENLKTLSEFPLHSVDACYALPVGASCSTPTVQYR